MSRPDGGGRAATFIGAAVVLVGLVVGVVLLVIAERRPEQVIDRFARAEVGCTTTLDIRRSGTYYVFQESTAVENVADDCAPTSDPVFVVDLRADGRSLAMRSEESIRYGVSGVSGRAVTRVEIVEPGRYELVVAGPDPTMVAAVGRDPYAGTGRYRIIGVSSALVGAVAGALAMVVGRRRRRRSNGATGAVASASGGPLDPPCNGVPGTTRSDQAFARPAASWDPPDPSERLG